MEKRLKICSRELLNIIRNDTKLLIWKNKMYSYKLIEIYMIEICKTCAHNIATLLLWKWLIPRDHSTRNLSRFSKITICIIFVKFYCCNKGMLPNASLFRKLFILFIRLMGFRQFAGKLLNFNIRKNREAKMIVPVENGFLCLTKIQ